MCWLWTSNFHERQNRRVRSFPPGSSLCFPHLHLEWRWCSIFCVSSTFRHIFGHLPKQVSWAQWSVACSIEFGHNILFFLSLSFICMYLHTFGVIFGIFLYWRLLLNARALIQIRVCYYKSSLKLVCFRLVVHYLQLHSTDISYIDVCMIVLYLSLLHNMSTSTSMSRAVMLVIETYLLVWYLCSTYLANT
jgi:hypothetical protein